jgi:hypothetical protein
VIAQQLIIFTAMLKAGLKLDLVGVPNQWKHTAPMGTTAPTMVSMDGGCNNCKKDKDDNRKRHWSGPFTLQNRQKGIKPHTNLKVPCVFAECKPLCQTEESGPVYFHEVMSKAGMQEGLQHLDVTGLPTNACLYYLCLGACAWPTSSRCKWYHLQDMDNVDVTALFKQIEPGIT